MTEQHTPGPWVVYHRKSANDPYSSEPMPEIMAENGPVVADIRWNGHNKTHGEANAKLIAAAPKLLGALEEATRHLSIALKAHGTNDERLPKVLEEYHTVIAEARGLK